MAVFDVAKIMDILAKQEADGYTFYEEAAGKVGDDKAGMLFERLAKDERKHEAFYKKQRAKYEGRLYEIEQEDADFIDILLSLPSPIDEAKKSAEGKVVWNKRQALLLAERLERDTILLLSQIVGINQEFASEKAFTEALKEEKIHLSLILQNTMDNMASSLML